MLQVLGRPNSVNVQKVMWCLAELDQEIGRVDLGGAYGGTDDATYRMQNPNGRIPTLIDGDYVLWESNAIVRYLCEQYDKDSWFPNTAQQRGHANQWMDWYQTSLHQHMTTLFWQLIRTPLADRDLAAITNATNTAAEFWTILEQHLTARPYILGDDISMADIPLGCAAYRWHCMEFERPELPALREWWEKLAKRPAYKRNVMLPLT